MGLRCKCKRVRGKVLIIIKTIVYVLTFVPISISFYSLIACFFTFRLFSLLFNLWHSPPLMIDRYTSFFKKINKLLCTLYIYNTYTIQLIRKHYFAFWFWIDLVATFPMELILILAGASGDGNDADGASRAKLLLRMLKVPRLLRVGRIFKQLDQGASAGAWRMLQTVFGLIILTHWFGCSFFFLCRVERDNGEAKIWEPFLDMWDLQDGQTGK